MRTNAKILVAGGFGVGKTTFVGSVSEIKPLRTEAQMTAASTDVDDITKVASKQTTTVAMDFGRRSLGAELMLYLFGTPGQDRFTFMWDDLARGAVGMVILTDVRRLPDCFRAIDFAESRDLPFVVACNAFPDAQRFTTDELRVALDIGPHVPVLDIDAREPDDVASALVALVEHALTRPRASAAV